MSDYIEVAQADAIPPGAALRTEIDDVPVAIFNCNGHLFAIDDTCTHEEASLSEGELVDDSTVECPLHGAQFDLRTGRALCLPATAPVRTYEVIVENGVVKVRTAE